MERPKFLFVDPAPFTVGKVIYSGGKVAVREKFALDCGLLRVFVGGAAFEAYPPAGMNVDLGMKRNYSLGGELAKQGIITLTGGTPVKSFPHAAAKGAADSGGIAICMIPDGGINVDEERWQPYSLVYMLDTGMGYDQADFCWSNPARVVGAHIGIYAGGKQGTNMEMAVDRQLCSDRAMGIIPGVGGIADMQRDIYPFLNGGHPLVASHDMAEMATKIKRNGMRVKDFVDTKMPFLVDSLIAAGIRVTNHHRNLEQIAKA